MTDAQRESALALLASCLDCSTLVVMRYGHDPRPYDVDPANVGNVIELLGLQTVLAQGIGIDGPGLHRCPPTREVIVAEENEWMLTWEPDRAAWA